MIGYCHQETFSQNTKQKQIWHIFECKSKFSKQTNWQLKQEQDDQEFYKNLNEIFLLVKQDIYAEKNEYSENSKEP